MLINNIFQIPNNKDVDIYCTQKLYQDKYKYLKSIYKNLGKDFDKSKDYLIIHKYLSKLVSIFLLNPSIFEVNEFINDIKDGNECSIQLFKMTIEKCNYSTTVDIVDIILKKCNSSFNNYYPIFVFLVNNLVCCEIIASTHQDNKENNCYINELLLLIKNKDHILRCHNIIKTIYKNETVSFLSFCNSQVTRYKYLLKMDSLLKSPEILIKDYSNIHNLLQLILYVWTINDLQNELKPYLQNKLWIVFHSLINIGVNSLYILRDKYTKINTEFRTIQNYVNDDGSYVVAVIDQHINNNIIDYNNHIISINGLINLLDMESYTYFYNVSCKHINSLIIVDSFKNLHLRNNYIVSNINLFYLHNLENNNNIEPLLIIKYYMNLLNLTYIPLLDRTEYINTLFTVLLKIKDLSEVTPKCFHILIKFYTEYNNSNLLDIEKEVIHYKIILIIKILLKSPKLSISLLSLFNKSNEEIVKYTLILLDDFKNILEEFFNKIKTYNTSTLSTFQKISKKTDICKIAYTINTYLFYIEYISKLQCNILLHEKITPQFVTVCNYYMNIILTQGNTIYSLLSFRLNYSTYYEILHGMIKCYTNLKYNTIFINSLYKNINENVSTLIDDLLLKIKSKIPVQLEIQLTHIRNKLNAKFKNDKTRENSTDIKMYDPIMHTEIVLPVLLPDSKIIVDKSVILQHLNNSETDPFTRSELTIKILEDYNKLKSTKEEINSQYAKKSIHIDV